jgi:hypothetical protein
MTTPQGLATYPGIAQILSASITLGHGISPSTAVITMAPQSGDVADTGTLTFQIGGTTVEFLDCKLDHGSYQRSNSGETWQITLLDRRWKWRFGQFSGKFNAWRENATLQNGDPEGSSGSGRVVDTVRTPQQLAQLYLDAMSESGYDVSALPNDTYPAVDHDYDNPAEALAELCDKLGCRIVLRLNNTVAIVRAGIGGALPDEFLLENSRTYNVPEKPDHIAVVCGPSFYQVDFPLEAVGLDRDTTAGGAPTDTIKPLDELSYKPPGGWSQADLPLLTCVASNSSEEDVTGLRPLAAKSVFRYYRIMLPVKVPGYDGAEGGLITKREQVLPLYEEQVTSVVENDNSVPLPSAVFGVWYPGLDELKNTAAELTVQGNAPAAVGEEGNYKSQFYQRGFALDAARGLVIFEEPVYRNSTPELPKVTPAPAKLVLRTKCQVRDPESLAVTRHIRQRSTDSDLGAGTMFIKREELVVAHVPTYDPTTYANFPSAGDDTRAATTISTASDVNDACDLHIDAALEAFEQPQPRQVQTAGIVPVELDGAIEQVTYQIGSSGATTTVAQGGEPSRYAVSYRERRRAEQLRSAATKAQQTHSSVARTTRRDAADRRPAR